MYGHGRRGVCDRRRVVMRKEEREGNRGQQLKVFVVESAPLSSLAMIGGTTDRAGSASSAGRTWTVAATGRWVGSASRPDHLRRLGGGSRRGVARPSVAARPSALPAMVD